jgi:hypothetical protein
MKKTKDNGLIEDLTLTRNHGVLVEKLTENDEKILTKIIFLLLTIYYLLLQQIVINLKK